MKPSARRTAAVASSVLVAVIALTGCGGSSGGGDKPADVESALRTAKENFDKATGVHFKLSTDADPSGDAILGADGKLTDQPAFEGTVKAKYKGFNIDVPVVSVDGTFYANLPFSGGFAKHDPSEFNAPDPADFIAKDKGFSGALLELQDAKKDGEKRSGSQIVTTYSATLSGALVHSIVPSANATKDFKAVVGIAEGKLTTLAITGDFFQDGTNATYKLVFDDYDKIAKISAP
jgi:lipoprotein LprG